MGMPRRPAHPEIHLSLSTRLILLLLVAVVPAVSVEVYNDWRLRLERGEELRRTATAQADMLSGEMQRIVTGMEQLLVAAANAPEALREDAACDAYMARLQQAFEFVSSIGVAGPDGQVRCLNEPFERGKASNADRRHFRVAMETGRFAIGDLFVGRVTGNKVFGFAYPVKDARTGQVSAVVFASLKFSWLAGQFARKPLPAGTLVVLADTHGRIITNLPGPDRSGTLLPASWLQLLKGASPGIAEKEPEPLFDTRDQILAYVPQGVAPEGISILVGLDRDRALREINAASVRSKAVAVLALLTGLLLTLLLVRLFIQRPLAAILDVVHAVQAGNLAARTGVLRTRSEIDRIAAALDHLLDEIGRRIREKQAVEDQLRAARDEAVRISAAKTEFLASASHDLRQPLQTLALIAQVLARPLPPGQQARSAQIVSRAVSHLGAMVETLVDVAQLDSGRIVPRMQPVHLASILSTIHNEFIAIAAEKGVEFTLMRCDGWVYSDPTLLSRILRNLVSNAIKFTPTGGRVTLHCSRGARGLVLAVEDTGVGIPADKQREIFEEFRQLDNPERDRRKGIGLGLAIVDKLARLLDHPLAVESAQGAGATFMVTVQPCESGIEQSRPAVEAYLRISASILVVEDDVLVAEATAAVLSSWGAAVTLASDVPDAIEQLATARFDAVLCDFRLPSGSGLDVLRFARSRASGTLCVLITGEAPWNVDTIAAQDGIPVLRKPVSPADFVRALQSLARAGTEQADE
jgi:signal transduction histidine kinase/ActR/RegA family two-component response regulator